MNDQILDESSCVQTVYREIEIGLDPKFMGNEERAIDRIIDNWKYKYNYELKGILLDYSHLKFMTDYGRIIDDQPSIYWKIGADFSVFNVSVGQLIKAKINRIGATYCGALVGNCIDATIILSDDLPKDEVNSYLRIDSEVIFCVNGFDASHCFIDGIINQNCFHKIQQLVPLTQEFNETFGNSSLFS